MQRVKVQLYAGTCTPHTNAQPVYLQLAADWAVPHPGDPLIEGHTCVSLPLITPCTPACPECTPSSSSGSNKILYFHLSPYVHTSSHPFWWQSLGSSPSLPPSLLPVCHPGCAVPPQLFPPGLCPLPWVPCGGKAPALSPCLDPDTNRKGRPLNDGLSKCAHWLSPTWLWVHTHTHNCATLTLFSFSFLFPSASLWQGQHWQWRCLFTMSLTCPHCTYPPGCIIKDYF